MTKLGYLLRETGTNLLRNITMSLAAIITVALSVALAGYAWVNQASADKATVQVDDGVEFIVWLDPAIPDDQRDAVQVALDESPGVSSYQYFDKDMAFAEFVEIMADRPDLIGEVTPEILPESYRVIPTDPDAEVVGSLAESFETRAGVDEVSFNFEELKRVQRQTRKVTGWLFALAVSALAVAVILMVNTAFMAMRSRKDDIEVMHLVGATNSYIRTPFMIEGLLQGFIGAALGVGLTHLYVWWRRSGIEADEFETIIAKLTGGGVVNGELWGLSIGLAIVGAVVGFLSSGLAVSLYLRD
jgi:cell division transport system permease protein